MTQRVHVTDRSDFKRCRRKYQFKQEGLVPKDKLQAGPLWFGEGVHQCLAEYYTKEPKDSIQSFFEKRWFQYVKDTATEHSEETLVGLSTDSDLAVGMLCSYHDQYRDSKLETIAIERELEVKVKGVRVKLVGKMDRLVIDENENLWVVDHKTAREFPPLERLEVDDQFTAYLWMLREHGIKVKGLIYNGLRKKLPIYPPLLQKGGLSKAQNIDTTRTIYLDAINGYGLDRADYEDVLTRLEQNRFFMREKVLRTRRHLDVFGENVAAEIREMSSKKTVMFPNFTKDCAHDCPYKLLCRCVQDGGDKKMLADMYFTYQEPRN